LTHVNTDQLIAKLDELIAATRSAAIPDERVVRRKAA